jgi:hypothetical protein
VSYAIVVVVVVVVVEEEETEGGDDDDDEEEGISGCNLLVLKIGRNKSAQSTKATNWTLSCFKIEKLHASCLIFLYQLIKI